MPEHYTRADWQALPPKPGPGPLDPAKVEGLAFHWPGMSSPLRGVNAVMAALRGWQRYHMNTRGWSDIAYQIAVDQDGNTYDLRGLRTQSAANGDTDVNERFGAVLLVVAPGEPLTPELVAAARRVVRRHRQLFPSSKLLVGHSQIRPDGTECPGPVVSRALDGGLFRPSYTRGQLVDHALRDIRQRLRGRTTAATRAALEAARRALRSIPRRPR